MSKQGESSNTPIEEYIGDTRADIADLPDDAPMGSYCFIIADASVHMKNSQGQWSEV
jgi:hypothetical protein